MIEVVYAPKIVRTPTLVILDLISVIYVEIVSVLDVMSILTVMQLSVTPQETQPILHRIVHVVLDLVDLQIKTLYVHNVIQIVTAVIWEDC
jgi:hypothetical protein